MILIMQLNQMIIYSVVEEESKPKLVHLVLVKKLYYQQNVHLPYDMEDEVRLLKENLIDSVFSCIRDIITKIYQN